MVRRSRSPYKKRIQVGVEILSEAFRSPGLTRDKLVAMVKRMYGRTRLSPLRGKAFPPDIYDKELATLYVIARYGLGLDHDYPEQFEKLFYREIAYEKAIESVMGGRYEEARRILEEQNPGRVIDSNTLARMLRVAFTKLVLGFMDQEEFHTLLKKTKEAFPEEERTVRSYARFYIAYRIAEKIYRGEIRDRISKELAKQGIAAQIGFPKTVPGDDYIWIIAREVFNIPEHILQKILKTGHGKNNTETQEHSQQ